MSRVINPEGAGKQRTQLMRASALALRELMKQTSQDAHTLDLAAFLALALEEIAETVESTVTPWEKRDYWVKADRFRMDWAWAGRLGGNMRKAVLAKDWAAMAQTAAETLGRLRAVEVPVRHKLGEPWVGAYKKLISE